MLKRLSTLAFTAALASLAAPVSAQTTSPQMAIYGNLDVSFESASYKGGVQSAPSRRVVNSNDSYVGLRGAENLGSLKAIYQVEGSVAVDAASSAFVSRDSFIGLEAATGSVKLGSFVLPYHLLTVDLDPFYGRTGSAYNVMGTPGHAGAPSDSPYFNVGRSNVIQVESARFGGFSGALAYLTNEGRSAAGNPQGWSLSATYDASAWGVGYGYERHADFYGLSTVSGVLPGVGESSRDSAHKVMGRLVVGPVTVGAVYEHLVYDNAGVAAGALDKYARNAYGLMGSVKAGPGVAKASWMRANAATCSRVGFECSGAGTAANAYSVGYSLHPSKRVEMYVQAARIDNGSQGDYNATFNPLGMDDGGDYRSVGLGMRVGF